MEYRNGVISKRGRIAAKSVVGVAIMANVAVGMLLLDLFIRGFLG
jgi:hypothetical protein